MPRNKRLHFKDLDTMRFIAFVPIFIYCFLAIIAPSLEDYFTDVSILAGKAAINSMDFFFFLSAFLLTSHGLREYKYRESFSFKNFIFRRALRLGIPFILLLVFIFIGHPWLVKVLKLQPITTPDGSFFALFIPNYYSNLNSDQYSYLIIAWTIYMFIQFYFVLGILLKFFKQYILILAGILIVVGLVFRIIHISIDSQWYFDTFCYGISTGFGMITAYLIRSESPIIEKIKHASKKLNSVIYFVGTVILILGYMLMGDSITSVIIPLLTSLFFGFVVIEQTFGKNSLYKLRSNRLMAHLGKISYGLIVYQSIINLLVIIAVQSLDFDITSDLLKLACLGAGFIISWIVADVSYNLLERPVLILRKEFKKL